MTELTRKQILKLADEVRNLERWESVMESAKEYFVGTPHKVVVNTGSEYNDNGGTYEYIESFEVFDKAGNELERNRKAIIGEFDEPPSGSGSDYDIADYWSDIMSEIDAKHGEYLANKPPKLSFPKVFAE